MNNKWTKEEMELLKQIHNKYTNTELGKIFNRTPSAIDNKKRRLGLTLKDKGKQDFFNVIDTEEKAYWLGFIYADGYIIKSKRNYELGIELNYKDIDHLYKFNKIFNNYYSVTIVNKTYNRIDEFNKIKKRNLLAKMCKIRIYSKEVYDDLVSNGIVQNKTKSEIFPKIENNDLFIHFLRGYIDGDGSYVINDVKNHKYPSISITGNNLEMFKFIQNKLKKDFNITSHIYKDKSCYKLYIRRKLECLKIINLMFENANIYLERKFQKINEIKRIALYE